MKALESKLEGGADMAYQPFYIVNAQNQEEDWSTLEEKDREYMKGMFPQKTKEIQDKVEEECDKLEYEGSMMFDEYPDKLMLRGICDRIYKEMQDGNEETAPYTEDEEENRETVTEELSSMGNRCTTCQRRFPFSEGPAFPPPPVRPPQKNPGFPPPPPRPPQFPSSQKGPGFFPPPPHPSQKGPGFPLPRPPKWEPSNPFPCSCPPGRPCRDCLVAMQTNSDWMRDMIEVLLYQEMLHRRSRRRRRQNYRRNY